jgi:hypothetical protein
MNEKPRLMALSAVVADYVIGWGFQSGGFRAASVLLETIRPRVFLRPSPRV